MKRRDGIMVDDVEREVSTLEDMDEGGRLKSVDVDDEDSLGNVLLE